MGREAHCSFPRIPRYDTLVPTVRLASTIAVLILLLPTPAARAAPSFTLNRYTAAEHPLDGFALRRPLSLGHLRLAAQLHADYALKPLVFERNLDDGDPLALVRHQATVHTVVALGLLDHLILFAGMPVHALLTGESLPGQPTASGFGPGDLFFGARGRINGPGDGPAAGARLLLSAPTAGGAEGGPAVTGDDGVAVLAELMGEVPMGPTALVANAGLRFRPDARVGPTRISDELTFGVSLVVHALPERLDTHLELSGAASLDDVGGETTTPLEAGLGVKAHLGRSWTVGASGGAGLLPAFGSPQLRASIMLGYRMAGEARPVDVPDEGNEALRQDPEAPPEEPTTEWSEDEPEALTPEQVAAVDPNDPANRDSDGDGMSDLDDRCPLVPGTGANSGCARYLTYKPDQGHFVLERQVRFERRDAGIRHSSDEVLGELAATLNAHPDYRVRVEAHVLSNKRPQREMAKSLDRARLVAAALAQRGVDATRMRVYGCGGNRPVTASRGLSRSRNERIEVWVTRPLPPTGMRSTMGCEQAE